MQSVSSNAVASALAYSEYEDTTNGITLCKWGRVVWVALRLRVNNANSPYVISGGIPSQYSPPTQEARTVFFNNSSDVPIGQAIIRSTGDIYLYLGNGGSFGTMDCIADWNYIV